MDIVIAFLGMLVPHLADLIENIRFHYDSIDINSAGVPITGQANPASAQHFSIRPLLLFTVLLKYRRAETPSHRLPYALCPFSALCHIRAPFPC